MPGKIQLLLPGLFDLPLSELPSGLINDELPALNRILRLASTRDNTAFSIDTMLGQALSLQHDHVGLPLAQAFATPLQRQSNRHLLFQAVHLRPDLHNAVIVPVPKNQENLNDIRIIINDLSDLFKVDCDISEVETGQYLMALKAIEAPSHYPHLLSVLGKPANAFVEQSRQHLEWYKLLNEMQMFLHAHDLNQDRERRELLTINSLWFWGGGRLPGSVDSDLAWYCDDSLLNQFATSLGLTPVSLDDLSGRIDSSSAVAIDLRLLEALKSGIVTELDSILLDIERKLLQPVLKAIEIDRKTLHLRAGHDLDLEMKAGAALKFWRRPRNLANWSRGAEAS